MLRHEHQYTRFQAKRLLPWSDVIRQRLLLRGI